MNKSLNNFINSEKIKKIVENNKEQDDYISDRIKVFSSEDEKLKVLGELLSNQSSRDIIKLLIDKEMYTNEIAKKLELRVSLVIHHLNKMESIGLLEINNKKIIRKGEEHRFFRIPSGMLIIPNESKKGITDKFLRKFFKNNIKFVAIGISALFVWMYELNQGVDVETPVFEKITETLFLPFAIIIIGLIIDKIWSYKKRKGGS